MVVPGNILSAFDKVSLSDIEGSSLLKRCELKFLLRAEELSGLLKELSPHYSLLTISGSPLFAYHTQYFDTPGFDMYLAHHNGRLNRYKIRQRTYIDSGKAYLEVKFRSNTNLVMKHRMPLPAQEGAWPESAGEFIAAQSPFRLQALVPAATISYSRMTLVNKRGGERVTIDLDVAGSSLHSSFKLSTFAVVEVKQQARMKSPVTTMLANRHIRPASFSKYCLAAAQLYPHLKKNNFKKKLTVLTKFRNEPIIDLIADHR